MKSSGSKRKLLFRIAVVCLVLIVVAFLWLRPPSRSIEEQRFIGTWTSAGKQAPMCFGQRYMTEFDGPNNDVGLWQWSIARPGTIRLYKDVLGRTIEEVQTYRIENGAIIFTLDGGVEKKLVRSETRFPNLEEAAN